MEIENVFYRKNFEKRYNVSSYSFINNGQLSYIVNPLRKSKNKRRNVRLIKSKTLFLILNFQFPTIPTDNYGYD